MTCPRCGHENPADAKFCLQCGSALGEAGGGRPREERKVVTVLFADLVGFTSQAEQMDPEEVRAVLQPYHAMLRADLERFGGTVEKFIGDAVMAVFGAPAAHEDDPERAVRAALAIRDAIVAEGRLHVRIGITTGEALVTLDARPEAGEGMAAGDVVNTAARLQGKAPVDGILVDDATHRATTRTIRYRAHDPVPLKGKAEPLPAHEVESARAGFGVDVRQAGKAPFVGRGREVDLLVGALERVLSEREPQLVTVMGVPGIGKSRIVWELFQHIDRGRRLVQWRQGRSLPYAERIPYWALGEIVKAETGILETDTPKIAEGRLASTIETLSLGAADAEWVARHLRPLVGIGTTAELHGDHRGEAFTAWRRFLEALAELRPLVLVFEDLHWADDGLLDLIDHILDWANGVPLLLVATSRPELLSRRPGWGGGKPNSLAISLGPLSDVESGQLVAGLVERADLPVGMRGAVLERAQGNPLYAEEFARLVAERGGVDHVPESVQGIIAARLDLLSPDEKVLLQHAAVVGKVFWSGAIAQMRNVLPAVVDEALHGLERKEFVRRERRSSMGTETEYAFRHILVRDVAYGQIPRGERGELHARAAAWIESLGRAADQAETLAFHYLSAIELAKVAGRSSEAYADRASQALLDAAERAMALNAFRSAARHYAAALELLAVDDPARPAVLLGYGKGLRFAEESGDDILAEAEAALSTAGRLDLAAEAAVLQAELTWYRGDGVATAAHVARAAERVDDLSPTASKAYVLSDLSRFAMLAGRHDDAIRLGRAAIAVAEPLGLDGIRAHALNNIGSSQISSGDQGGVDDLRTALEVAEAANSPEAARILNNLAVAYSAVGDFKHAAEYGRTALERARELGNLSVERFTAGQIPLNEYIAGHWDDALRSAEAFMEDARSSQGHIQESSCRLIRARIRFGRDDVDGALDDAAIALELTRRVTDHQNVLPALVTSAWLAQSTGDVSTADALLDEALPLGLESPNSANVELMRSLVARERLDDGQRVIDAMSPSPRRDLFIAVGRGDFQRAADLCAGFGVVPMEAFFRLSSAELLAGEGRVEEALVQLALAREFWVSVRATRYLADADRVAAVIDRVASQQEVPAPPGG